MKGFGKGFPRPLGKDAAEMQRFASDRKHRLRDFVGNLHEAVGKDLLRFSTEKLAKAKELVEAGESNTGMLWDIAMGGYIYRLLILMLIWILMWILMDVVTAKFNLLNHFWMK